MLKTLISSVLFLSLVISCKPKPPVVVIKAPPPQKPASEIVYEKAPTYERQAVPGYPLHEFRGLWVASIANIDWPSKRGLSTENQKNEFSRLVSKAHSTGINALLVQVRAASDAFYARSSEPWSEWLMGQQGVPPSPFYDPLEFMIEETHQSGIEFHAWLNLNRGKHKNATSVLSDHLTHTKPEWFLSYDGYKLFNFGIPEVRDYIASVVVNIVRNYDVDGIHFDDYFYPYKVNGESLKDEATFRKYPAGFRNIEDWRRNNIDLMIKQIAYEIKKQKPWVVFGISPFGVWRNKNDDPEGSATRGGQPSYDYMFADTRKWARQGWIDYITPQIYFPFEHKLVPYGTLADWWAKNCGDTRLYIGHGIYRAEEKSDLAAWRDPNQIPRQIEFNRKSNKIDGSIFYSANALAKNKLGLTDSLRNHFKYPAITPEIRTIAKTNSAPVQEMKLEKVAGEYSLSWKGPANATFLLYYFGEYQTKNLADPRNLVIVSTSSKVSFKTNTLKAGYLAIVVRERGKLESDPVFTRVNP